MSSGPEVSVVMPVHRGVRPEHLRSALQSLADQTRLPDEVVLVEDGPIDAEHHRVIADAADRLPLVRVVLSVNSGPGVANGRGLRAASGTWIVKADADDVNHPERIRKQLEVAIRERLDVCSAPMLEFEVDPAHPSGLRHSPLTHEEARRRMRWNNPVNHPAACFRREAAMGVGGYRTLRQMEDYDLFARMMASGARFGSVSEPLVAFRADPAMYRRRAGREMASYELHIQTLLRDLRLIGPTQKYTNLFVRRGARMLPLALFRRGHRRLFGSGL